ncbi:MAG: endonuclease MutS2 [Microcoleus sp. PH2017_10_PVI_O_A]|nr:MULTISPECIES: endonuclease MutS2 [unclassified Microcoleus]TAE81773.1 MAG: endonuclease MutS2 [Oscillatoriales cyanobacterium]MCC3406956.1 endonuclease MutS2 [Microcoleus sp. PH2017_10_PVI_O_A]MCC3461053.1 endonuclease MutS2 [Microcoleus sp. PH2017_11_PCY_U_A]MCC3479545.1 endonuclease MutS2 [Microcoleus sp. PH2017_12_PCY_D_A]MCC3526743.1 endonuclease MutS2 [Microcoleus sp. PH2017_21_RUC_O_A]
MPITNTTSTLIQSETLELLEWPRLCQHLATFAATKLGVAAALDLQIPATQAQTAELLAQTQEAYQLESRAGGALSFEGIQDIGSTLQRAELQGLLSGEELLAIATTLAGARQLRRIIDSAPDVPTLKELASQLRTYPEIEQEIHRCIDDRAQVADRATPKLAGIRVQMRQLRDRIYQILQGILQRQSNAVQEQVITQRSSRFVIPVKAPQKDAIPGIVHDSSASGATLYVEPHNTVNLNNQMRQLLRQEQAEEEAVRRALTEQVAAVKPDLDRLVAVVTTLDLAAAKARYGYWLQANPPKFIDLGEPELSPKNTENIDDENSGEEKADEEQEEKSQVLIRNLRSPITLRQLRHPLLVWQQQHEQGFAVVPVDLTISPQIRVVAITGPNTGGKTVTLKTLGLAALMAKAGMFVAAREPVELPWFDNILADIGDEQSLQQSLSTFSGHIRRISRILEALHNKSEGESPGEGEENSQFPIPNSQFPMPNSQCPIPKSLVLLDEVGAGTDPSEGSALAIALLQYLAQHSLLTVATTHFGELKALKYQDARFENASVEFDDNSMQPTYRLLWGIPGRSNALTIAKRLGLLASIVEEAQTYVGGASQDVNQVIAGLEAQRRRQETKAREATQLLHQTEKLHKEVSQKAAALQERERELKIAQEVAVNEAIGTAKSEIAQIIRRLQAGDQTAQNAQMATETLNQISQKHLPSRKQPAKPKPGFMPKTGDRIRIPSLGQTAEVLSGPDANEELSVRFGIMKMTVKLADVESLDGEKPETKAQLAKIAAASAATAKAKQAASEPAKPNPEIAIRTANNSIDLRGARVSDAEIEIDRALSKAVEYGALWIIHGKGTGQLRRGVHEFLATHPQVSRFELASQKEGGGGVTLVYLK